MIVGWLCRWLCWVVVVLLSVVAVAGGNAMMQCNPEQRRTQWLDLNLKKILVGI
jgi:hypothetical protein